MLHRSLFYSSTKYKEMDIDRTNKKKNDALKYQINTSRTFLEFSIIPSGNCEGKQTSISLQIY